MKTREQIYGKEASELLRDISNYHCIRKEQLLHMYSKNESTINNLLSYLVKQGRIYYNPITDIYYDSPEFKTDKEMLAAIWVLIDFKEKVQYHSPDDFPVKIIFFANEEIYEIIYISPDKESLIEHKLSSSDDDSKKIIIVEELQQIEHIHIPAAAFCTVDIDSGNIAYYR